MSFERIASYPKKGVGNMKHKDMAFEIRETLQ